MKKKLNEPTNEMWQCDVCRVDNELVRTCRRSGLGADDHCDDKDGKNDIGALCRHLLRAHGIQRQLRAALYVSQPSFSTRNEREYLFQSHSLPFPMLIPIPIPNPKFGLLLFPFPSHSHWLFPFTPAPIPVLLIVSRSDNKWPVNSTMHTTDKSSK